MTTGLFWISYAAVWVLLLVLAGAVLILFRFTVRAYRTQARYDIGDVGAMIGPPLDAGAPTLELRHLNGDSVSVGSATGSVHLVVFAKGACPKCTIALEVLRSFASEHARLTTTVVCGGSRAAIEDCASRVRPPLTAVADLQWEGAKAWQVSAMPFGVLLDSAGFVRARGDPTSATMLTILSHHLEASGHAASITTSGDRPNDHEVAQVRV